MKKKLAGLIVLAMILTCCLLPSTKVYADDGAATLQPSSTEVTVGDTFSVTLTVALNAGVPGATTVDYALVFEGGCVALDGDNKSGQIVVSEDPDDAITTYSKTFSFTALSAGDATIYANLADPYDKEYGFGFMEPFEGHNYALLPVPKIVVHVNEVPTEPPTEAPTEPITDAPTEPITDAPTEPVTDAPTQPPLGGNANLILPGPYVLHGDGRREQRDFDECRSYDGRSERTAGHQRKQLSGSWKEYHRHRSNRSERNEERIYHRSKS